MIQAEIKLYDEPVYQTQTYQSTNYGNYGYPSIHQHDQYNYKLNTQAEIDEDLEKFNAFGLHIGMKLKNTRSNFCYEIAELRTTVGESVTRIRGRPAFIRCYTLNEKTLERKDTWTTPYSLPELLDPIMEILP